MKTSSLEETNVEPMADLNFKVRRSFHRDFKLIATELDLSMREFLERVMAEFVANNAEALKDVAPTLYRRSQQRS